MRDIKLGENISAMPVPRSNVKRQPKSPASTTPLYEHIRFATSYDA